MNRVGNEEMRRKTVVIRELADRAEQGVLRWFGYIDRMNEGHLGEDNNKI